MPAGEHFDAVVVGSGFGGSVTAYRLAEAGMRVCLLERGKAYPPGAFARTPKQMAANFWNPSEGGHGLFQAWAFTHIDSIVSAGLGGGSLIYANVLLRKDERWFVREDAGRPGYEYWPVTREDLDAHYDRVEAMMRPQTYPLDQEPYRRTPKTLAFREAAESAGFSWFLPPLAVTFANEGQPAVPGEPIVGADGRADDNLHRRTRYTCRLVGECDIGCNFGSKNSLDYNYLTQAERLGVDMRTRCEVRSFQPGARGYLVHYVEHRPENEGCPTNTRMLPLVTISANQLILSAGVFGSTYLLLRNSGSFPHLSRALGTHFSGNGDLLGFVHNPAHGRDLDPMLGSVITSSVRVPDAVDGGDGPGFYLQEGGVPQLVGWVLEAADTPAELFRAIRFLLLRARAGNEPRTDVGDEVSAFLGDAHVSSGLMVLLGMGRDAPDGVMRLTDHRLQLAWSTSTSRVYFDRVRAAMARVATALNADLTINPLWYARKVVTVHGLGGCPMGRNDEEGVVDSTGQVFHYPGLYVADGSVMPGPVGPNPSLTIAALADRFADHMLAGST
jgi:cholesterol oxidase